MKLVIQRVNTASVEVENQIIGKINQGILIFLGISKDFNKDKQDYMIRKILSLRLWGNEEKGFQKNIEDINGEILIVSQFTLFGNCSSGTKPKFNDAMPPSEAKLIYDNFIEEIKSKTNLNIQTGVFGAKMKVNLENDGPLTFIIEK